MYLKLMFEYSIRFIFIILLNFNNLKTKQKWSITLLAIKDSKAMGKWLLQ